VKEILDEVEAWREQCIQELGLWRACLRALAAVDADDVRRATNEALGLMYLWPLVRRAAVTVMGARCSFRPVLSQWADGQWRYDASSLEEDNNATDQLVRFTLSSVAALTPRE